MLFAGLSIADLIATALALLVAITFHEFAHAWTADQLGDPTARYQGRLTLDPLAHLDPLGTLMILVARFGWGKPVPVNPYNLRHGPLAGMAMVSFAGPLSNVILAILFGLPLRFGIIPFDFGSNPVIPSLGQIVMTVILLNVSLAVFNLLPVAPLDGFKVALGLMPRQYAYDFARLEQYGPFILVGIILLGSLPGLNLMGLIFDVPVGALLQLILGF